MNLCLLCPALLAGSPFTPQGTARTRQSRLINGIPSSKEHCRQPEEDTTTNPHKSHLFMAWNNQKEHGVLQGYSCGKHSHLLKWWTSSQAVQHSLTQHCEPPSFAFCGTFWAPPLKVFLFFFFLRLTPLPSLYARTTNLTRFKTNDEIKCCISPHRTEVTCCKMHLCHKMHPCAAVGTALAQPQSGCPLHSPSESSVEPGISNRYQWFLFLLMCSGFSLVWLFFIALTEVKILARCQR